MHFNSTRKRYHGLIRTVLVVSGILFTHFSRGNHVHISLNDTEGDATPTVLKTVLNGKENGVTSITFEKGEYHFYPDKAYETYVYNSNHDDQLTHTAFPLLDYNKLTVDGNGSTFIFHGKISPFLLNNSDDITIKNLTVDWAMTFHSEGTVVAVDSEKKSFDIKISKEYPYVIRNGEIFFQSEYFEHTIGQSIFFDAERKGILFETNSITPLGSAKDKMNSYGLDQIQYKYERDKNNPAYPKTRKQPHATVKEIEPGIVRFLKVKRDLPKVGDVFVCKGNKGNNRLAPCFSVTESKNIKVQDVTVHHASGMGIIAMNSEDVYLHRMTITPSKGRYVSTTADASHFNGCRGTVELDGCVFTNMMDDGLNVHGTYQRVLEKLDDHTIGVRIGHNQQKNFLLGRPGDEVGTIRLEDSFFPKEKLHIEEVVQVNGRYHTIRFKEKLPTDLQVGDLLENLDAYPEVTVKNCTIKNNRARGLLISTPKKTIIENNYFHTQMGAILMPVESGSWYESGSAQDVTIRNNTFQDCVHSSKEFGVIHFETDDESNNIAFKNIVIKNNTFNHYDNLIVRAINVDGLKIEKNTITKTDNFPQLHKDNPAFLIEKSKNLKFKNNQYKGEAEVIIKTDNSDQ